MVTATAEWGTYDGWSGTRDVGDAEEALSLCSDIEAHLDGEGVLLGFTTSSGHFFAIGLGHEHSCTMYWESSDPPYFQSLGSHESRERIDFAYDGQLTELPGTVRISADVALQALAEFMETGRRPECVTWEET